ncbi:MAG: hypothetical protein KC621_21930 [Myxococcales bacterium]|nr:hypothetical protein [Myxococcales bacterium]
MSYDAPPAGVSATGLWSGPSDHGSLALPPLTHAIRRDLRTAREGDVWAIRSVSRSRSWALLGRRQLDEIRFGPTETEGAQVSLVSPTLDMVSAPTSLTQDGDRTTVETYYGHSPDVRLGVLDDTVRQIDLTLHWHRPMPNPSASVVRNEAVALPLLRHWPSGSTVAWDLEADPLALSAVAMSPEAWASSPLGCPRSCLARASDAAWLDTVGLRVPVQVVGPHLVAEFVWVEEPSSGDVVVIVASRPDDELVWISVASWP